jgi:hypothetical protein
VVGPCAPGTATSATIGIEDYEGGKGGQSLVGSATATHTIRVSVDFGDSTVVDDESVKLSVSPPATIDTDSILHTDTPGPLPITVTWLQRLPDSIDECSASASTTIQVQAPVPLRLSKRPKRLITKYSGGFSSATVIGPHADRRPIEVRLRSWRRAKLPGAQVPFKSTTVGLRATDKGFDRPAHGLRTPRYSVLAYFIPRDRQVFIIDARSKVGSIKEKPVGFEIVVLQAGRQLARIRGAGKCGVFGCKLRVIKVQR